MKHKLLLLFLFSLPLTHAFSQGYSIKHYDLNDGIPSNTINHIDIDKNGYLWLLTKNGLTSFDSKKFKNNIPEEKFEIGFYFFSGVGIPGVMGIDNRAFRCLPNNKIIFQTTDSLITFQNGIYHKSSADSLAKRIYDDPADKNHFTVISGGAVDKDGYEWYYSKHVYCFDGKITKLFNKKQGLCNDSLIIPSYNYFNGYSKFLGNPIAIDNKGIPWIFSKKGAYRYNGNTFDHLDIQLNAGCYGIFEDSKGRIWFETEKKGLLYCYEKGVLKMYNLVDVGPAAFFAEFAEDQNGKLFFTSSLGLIQFDNGKFTLRTDLPKGLPCVLIDKQNNLILSSSTKGVFINNGAKTTQIKELKNITIRQIIVDDENNYWIATGNGLYMIRPVAVTNYNFHEMMGANVHQYYHNMDMQDRIWLTADNVVYHFNGDTLVKIKEMESYGSFTTEANDGNMYLFEFTTKNQNAYYISKIHCYQTNGALKEIKDKSIGLLFNSTSSAQPQQVFAYGDHFLCILLPDVGIFTFDGKQVIKDLSFDEPTSVKKLDDEHIMLFRKNAQLEFDLTTKQLSPVSTISGLVEFVKDENVDIDKFNNFWVRDYKNKTLIEYSGNKTIKYTSSDSLIKFKKRIYISFHDKTRETFYFITDLGFTTLHIGADNKLSNEFVSTNLFTGYYNYKIAKDGTVWLCNEDGIISFDPKNLKNSFQQYNLKNGMFDVNCYQLFEDSKGNMWSSTQNGYVMINPKHNYKNTIESPLNISNIRLFYENVDLSNYCDSTNIGTQLPMNLTLPYSKNHITFDFVGVCFTQSDLVKYKFMLQGLDTAWQATTSQNAATYSNLPPGAYTFKLLSCNNDGLWRKEPVTFSFTIQAPWYRNNWAYAGYVIGFISIVFGFNGVRTRQLKLRQQELEKTVIEKTAEVVAQKELIEEKQKEVIDSITYARRIQHSLLPTEKYIEKTINRLKK